VLAQTLVTAAVTVAVSVAAVAVRVPDPVMIGYPFLITEKTMAAVGKVDGGP
jgi:hypothetical protein